MAYLSNILNLDPIYGLPCFKLPHSEIFEGGDCGHNTFTVLYASLYTGQPVPFGATYALLELTSPDNWPRRSPDTSAWYGRPDRCSRDLLTPYLCYVGTCQPFYWRQLRRALASNWYMFANNRVRNYRYDSPEEHARLATPDVPYEPRLTPTRDFLGPDMWAIMLRSALKYDIGPWLRPIAYIGLYTLDIHNAFSVLLEALKPSKDIRNLALKVHFSANVHPTWLSKATLWAYKAWCKPVQAIEAYWAQPGQPRVDLWLAALFVKKS